MLEPKKPENEEDRLNSLNELEILDTPDEERFSRITRIAKIFFGVDIATISFIDSERQWFKGIQGLNACETPRNISFCGHTILQEKPFIIRDAKKDKRFFDNPLVISEPYIRFYAGIPIIGPRGHRVGALCIINKKPMELNKQQRILLKDLASWVECELKLTRIKLIADSLQRSEDRLALATESANIGVWDWAIASNVLIWDERMYRIYGITKETFSGAYEAWEKGVHPEDRDRAVLELKNAVEKGKEYNTEFRVCWPDKTVHYIRAFGRVRCDAKGIPLNVIGVNWDITLEKEQENIIRELTLCDDLTGLYNRRGFKILAEQKIKEMDRLKKNTAIFLMDIDKMKKINDEHGHLVGDKALKAAADVLKKSCRKSDIICRWGGDEFIILAEGVADDVLTDVKDRIEANLRQYNLVSHQPFQLKMSIGEFIKEGSLKMSIEDLIQEADSRMYEMKKNR